MDDICGCSGTICFFRLLSQSLFGRIHIQWIAESKVDEIAIYDLLGRKVFAQSLPIGGFDEISINPNLPAGIYLLKVGAVAQRIVRY